MPRKRSSSSAVLLAKALAVPSAPPVPADCKRAQELFAQVGCSAMVTVPRRQALAHTCCCQLPQFKKGKKRRQAQEEAEELHRRNPNSALCIALAKMHMTVAVEQVGGG